MEAYLASLDKNRYFTGSYCTASSKGAPPNAVMVTSLPPDTGTNKETCWKYDTYEVEVEVQVPIKGEPTTVPIIDETTGEQKLNESGSPMFDVVEEITYETQTRKELTVGWIFDEEKYNRIKDEALLTELRAMRVKEFELIDKMQLPLYYNSLTDEQRQALADYRQAWLDAPENKQIPVMPECLQSLKLPL